MNKVRTLFNHSFTDLDHCLVASPNFNLVNRLAGDQESVTTGVPRRVNVFLSTIQSTLFGADSLLQKRSTANLVRVKVP